MPAAALRQRAFFWGGQSSSVRCERAGENEPPIEREIFLKLSLDGVFDVTKSFSVEASGSMKPWRRRRRCGAACNPCCFSEDMAMRSSEFAPLFRSTVGFDRLFDMLENSVRTEWPPYNIEKTGESAYRITMAVAGFGPEDVELTQHGPELTVTGQKKADATDRQFLHKGLSAGNFKQVFKLADYVKVANASLEYGLLSIDLAREIPEELKPRRIAIAAGGSSPAGNGAEKQGQISQDTKPRKAA
jgi:molecular chaperone IbpA